MHLKIFKCPVHPIALIGGMILGPSNHVYAEIASSITMENIGDGNGQAPPLTATISGDDLLQGPEFASAILDAPLIGGHDVNALRDGLWGDGQDGSGASAIAFGNGNSVEFYLNTILSPNGYDLTSIVVSSWWSLAGGGRSEHTYSISVSYAGDPGFVELAPLTHYSPGDLATVTQVTLENLESGTNPARGVDAIRFEFGGNPVSEEGANGANFIREIDVFGTPAAGSTASPAISSITIEDDIATLTFSGKPNTTYTCKSSQDLTAFEGTANAVNGTSFTTGDDTGDGTGTGTAQVILSGTKLFFRLEE